MYAVNGLCTFLFPSLFWYDGRVDTGRMRASLSVGFLSLTLWMRALKVRSFKSVSEVVVSMKDLKGKRRAWKLLNFS